MMNSRFPFRLVFLATVLGTSLSAGAATPKCGSGPDAAKCGANKNASVQTMASGVVIDTKVMGKGARPTATSVVKVHYRGTLDNGQEFDSSFKRGEPAVFPLNRVIPCWTEGVSTMAVGGKAALTCPAETAYGARGAGASVPPNARLTFEVELLDILK